MRTHRPFVQRKSIPHLSALHAAGADGLRPKDLAKTDDTVAYQSARSLLSRFNDRGLVDRVGYGRYRITVAGRRMLTAAERSAQRNQKPHPQESAS